LASSRDRLAVDTLDGVTPSSGGTAQVVIGCAIQTDRRTVRNSSGARRGGPTACARYSSSSRSAVAVRRANNAKITSTVLTSVGTVCFGRASLAYTYCIHCGEHGQKYDYHLGRKHCDYTHAAFILWGEGGWLGKAQDNGIKEKRRGEES